MEKGKLFVFAGRPGVGKTTIIKKLFSKETIILFNQLIGI